MQKDCLYLELFVKDFFVLKLYSICWHEQIKDKYSTLILNTLQLFSTWTEHIPIVYNIWYADGICKVYMYFQACWLPDWCSTLSYIDIRYTWKIEITLTEHNI